MNGKMKHINIYKLITKEEMRKSEDQEQRPKYIISVSDWLIVYLIQCIPVVNIIFLFIWAYSKNTPASKCNWAKASLIVSAIFIVFIILLP